MNKLKALTARSLQSESLLRWTGYLWCVLGVAGGATLFLVSPNPVREFRAAPSGPVFTASLFLLAFVVGVLLVRASSRGLVLALSLLFALFFALFAISALILLPAPALVLGICVAGLALSVWSIVLAVYGLSGGNHRARLSP
jgi:hypothetical protein